MPRYPEWFVGGPWHGKDKLREAPNINDRIRVATVRPFDISEFINPSPTTEFHHDEYTYVPRHARIFGETLTVWISEHDAGLLASGHDTEVSRLLGQLIMSPHRVDEADRQPFNVGGVAQRHRDLFELERQATREADRRFRQRITQLEAEIQRLRSQPVRHCGHVIVHPNQQLQRDMRPTAIMELVDDDHNHDFVVFGNITLFFDEGNDEIPPSWVATAQGEDDKPYTGYGTSKRGAIIALLADALDVYARMIETERIR